MPYKSKEAQAKASHEWYVKNRQSVKGRSRISNDKMKKKQRQFVADLLARSSCVDCGNNDSRVLEFDHVRGEKKGNIANLKNAAYGMKRLLDEIAKCDIRCANCHRIVTHERRLAQTAIVA